MNTITFPGFGEEEKATKDKIIDTLLSTFPLSAREVHNKISKRTTGQPISYKGTYKAITELASKQILQKNPEGYKVSTQWIAQLRNYAENAQNKQNIKDDLIKKIISNTNAETTTVVFKKFKRIADLDQFYLQELRMELKEDAYTTVHHPWFPIFYPSEIIDYTKKLKNKKRYIRTLNTTPLDQYCRQFLNKMGEKTKTLHNPNALQFGVYGDYITQIYIPKQTSTILKQTYQNTKNIKDINLLDLHDTYLETKTTATLALFKNHQIATLLKAQFTGQQDIRNYLPQNQTLNH